VEDNRIYIPSWLLHHRNCFKQLWLQSPQLPIGQKQLSSRLSSVPLHQIAFGPKGLIRNELAILTDVVQSGMHTVHHHKPRENFSLQRLLRAVVVHSLPGFISDAIAIRAWLLQRSLLLQTSVSRCLQRHV
jgi:hypothetical protein